MLLAMRNIKKTAGHTTRRPFEQSKTQNYKLKMMRSAYVDVPTFCAPSICRARSYVTIFSMIVFSSDFWII